MPEAWARWSKTHLLDVNSHVFPEPGVKAWEMTENMECFKALLHEACRANTPEQVSAWVTPRLTSPAQLKAMLDIGMSPDPKVLTLWMKEMGPDHRGKVEMIGAWLREKQPVVWSGDLMHQVARLADAWCQSPVSSLMAQAHNLNQSLQEKLAQRQALNLLARVMKTYDGRLTRTQTIGPMDGVMELYTSRQGLALPHLLIATSHVDSVHQWCFQEGIDLAARNELGQDAKTWLKGLDPVFDGPMAQFEQDIWQKHQKTIDFC